jgi:lysophospholipid acyltransferase (LPLAT)-like uncharacterized protein
MADGSHQEAGGGSVLPARRRGGYLRAVWRSIRKPLAQSTFVKGLLVSFLAHALRFTRWTNPLVNRDLDIAREYDRLTPAILALWHGQHLLIPFYYPKGKPLVVMVSRSADAEINARVVEKIGFEAVRGSGGRDPARHLEKGGARALIALKKALDAGSNVAMIADIPHGTPREAGMGIITLAKVSGRPIVPLALASTRRVVIEKSWDKTTISLPFGRAAIILGELVHVPADAGPEVMEEMRRRLTDSLNAATGKAYRMVDARHE